MLVNSKSTVPLKHVLSSNHSKWFYISSSPLNTHTHWWQMLLCKVIICLPESHTLGAQGSLSWARSSKAVACTEFLKGIGKKKKRKGKAQSACVFSHPEGSYCVLTSRRGRLSVFFFFFFPHKMQFDVICKLGGSLAAKRTLWKTFWLPSKHIIAIHKGTFSDSHPTYYWGGKSGLKLYLWATFVLTQKGKISRSQTECWLVSWYSGSVWFELTFK